MKKYKENTKNSPMGTKDSTDSPYVAHTLASDIKMMNSLDTPLLTKGVKYDSEKPRMHLLPPKAITEVAKVLTFGAQKYDEDNWRKLDDLQNRYTSGALRHIFAHMDGEQLDPESGISHLAHALCCLLFKLEIELEQDLLSDVHSSEAD